MTQYRYVRNMNKQTDMVFLMYQSKQQFCNKHIITIVLIFVYCVEVLLCVSTLSGHHQAIIT
jgi:hypothetical protein